MAKYKVVHYINQFFAGIGGEEKADHMPEVREGAVGPGMGLKAVKRDNISYNISLPVRRAIFLQVLKKPYFLGLSAHFPFLGFGNKARIFAGTFQS